jgi:WD40 repeat protein
MNEAVKLVVEPAKMWEWKTLEHERQLLSCAFSPCGKFVFAGGFDRCVQRWTLDNGEKQSLAGHASWTDRMAFHPDGVRLFTGDYVGGICAWDYAAADPKPLWSKPDAHPNAVRSLSVSSDGKWLATCSDAGQVVLWSPEGELVRRLEGHSNRTFSTAFHPDGKSLLTGDQLGCIKHWEVATGRLARTFDAGMLWKEQTVNAGDVCGVRRLAFDPSGATLAAAGIGDLKGSDRASGTPTVVLFDWESGTCTLVMKNPKTTAYADQVLWHPEGMWIAGGHGEDDDGLAFWKAGETEPFHTLNFMRLGTRDLDLHPAGIHLAICHWKQNGDAGNSRTSKTAEEYNRPHHGQVRIFQLTEKPAVASESPAAPASAP